MVKEIWPKDQRFKKKKVRIYFNANSYGFLETISKERIIELVCLLLGALTKISIKYPELKHNTLLIHIKLLEKKEELPMIINNKIMVNLKLLKESAATLILLEAGS